MGRPSNLQIRVTSDSQQARSDIQGAETQITGTLGKLKSAGPALALAAGAAIGAALIGGISKALDQSKITGRLGAQLGATPQEAGRLGKLAGRLYAKGITSDFQSAADAISATMRSGLLPTGATEAQIQKIATKAQNLATVFDQEVGGTTRAVSQLLRTGLVKSADEAFDVLTTGFQKGTNAADDLLDTFTEYSTQFRDMGLSAKQALGLIQQGLAGGARDADIVADALKELNIRVKDKSAAEGLKELGLNADAMAKQFAVGGEKSAQALDLLLDKLNAVQDPAERTRLAVLLLGTQAEDLAGALFNLDPSKAVDALGQVEGAADRMATTLHDNAGAQLDAFKQKAEQTFVEFLGGKVVPELMRFHSWFQDKIMPVVKEVGALYITYLTPILGAVRDGIRKVSEAVKENEQDWIPLWNFIKAKVVPLMGGALAEALSKSFDALALIVKILGDVVGGFKRVKNGIEDVIEWLRRLGAFKVPGWISDIVGLSGLSTTFTQVSKAQPGLMTMRGGIVSTTPAITMTPRFRISPMQVNVTIDGQQLQGRIDRTVRGAFLADGARYAAGGRI